MALEIEFSDVANSETDAAYLYLSRHSPDVAIRWLRGLETALFSLTDSLKVLPSMGQIATENDQFPDVTVYQYLYGKGFGAYRVLYYLVDADDDGENDTLRVLHVRHGAQEYINSRDEE